MSVAAHYDDTDLALFALQLLESDEHRAVADHVNGCAFCRQELARLQGDLATCAYGVEMYDPAAVVRERVMRQVAREKKIAPVEEIPRAPRFEALERPAEPEEPTLEFRRRAPESTTAHRRSHPEKADRQPRPGSPLRGVSLWLGWTVAACLAVMGTRMYFQHQDDQAQLRTKTAEAIRGRQEAEGARRLLDALTSSSAQQVLLTGTAAAAEPLPEGHVIYSAKDGALVLLAEHLAALEPEKVYELWLIPSDGRDPIPAGAFRPDDRGDGRVILPPLPKAVTAKAFGITIEEGAGGQSPTMPIVLAGS